MPRLIKVIKWSNGQVMVFNFRRKQMPEYQGEHADVREKILKDCDQHTRFYEGEWNKEVVEIDKKKF